MCRKYESTKRSGRLILGAKCVSQVARGRSVEGLVGGCGDSVFTLRAMGALEVGNVRYT